MAMLPLIIPLNPFFTPNASILPTHSHLAEYIKLKVNEFLHLQPMGIQWKIYPVARLVVKETDACMQFWMVTGDAENSSQWVTPADIDVYINENGPDFFTQHIGWHFPSTKFYYDIFMGPIANTGVVTMGPTQITSMPPPYTETDLVVGPVGGFVEGELMMIEGTTEEPILFHEWGAGVVGQITFHTDTGQTINTTHTLQLHAPAVGANFGAMGVAMDSNDTEELLVEDDIEAVTVDAMTAHVNIGDGSGLTLAEHINHVTRIIVQDMNIISIPQLENDAARMVQYMAAHAMTDLTWLTAALHMSTDQLTEMCTELGQQETPFLYPGTYADLEKGSVASFPGMRKERKMTAYNDPKNRNTYFHMLMRYMMADSIVYPIGGVDEPSGFLVWVPKPRAKRISSYLQGNTPFSAVTKEKVLEDVAIASSYEASMARGMYSSQKEAAKILIHRLKTDLDEAQLKVPNVIEFKNPYTWS